MIADAPWVRDAELNGIGESLPDPVCPVCGAECEHIFLIGGEVVGCECCVEVKDACEWDDERRYREKWQ